MTTLDEDLAADEADITNDPETATVDVTIGGKYRRLKFTRLDGLKWAEFAAQCDPNPRSSLDVSYGYNLRGMTLLAAPASGVLLDGDDEIQMTEQQWTKYLRTAPGRDHRAIANTLFSLNEWLPSVEVSDARKAFEDGSVQSSSSPEASESLAAD